MLLDSKGTALKIEGSSSIPPEEWAAVSVPLGQGIAGQVALSGKSILVTGRGELPRAVAREKARAYLSDSYISVALPSSEPGPALGVINVTDREDSRPFGVFDLELLESIARLMASAIESQRLWARSREASEHLSDAIDGLPIGMFTVTAGGALRLCNRAARRYLGLATDAKLGRPWEAYFPAVAVKHVRRALDDLARGRKPLGVEFEIPLGADAGSRAVRLSALEAEDLAPLDSSHVLFIVEDLGKERELADLRRSDRMKSNFLSLISHELRTPLAAIKGAVQLLGQMPDSEGRLKSAERIFCVLGRNSERLTRLVNSILDAIDLEAGSMSLYRKRLDLNALTENIVRKFQGHGCCGSPRNWSVQLDADSSEAYVDESRFGQVIEHLIENALKFSSPNGSIAIASESSDGYWRLRVSNSGRNIDPALHERIFSKFYQAEATMTREIGGSGLGLYLCREIMRLHDGDVRLDPDFTGGACFVVSVPEREDSGQRS